MVHDSTITIRQATIDDIPDLVKLRRLMFESMGYEDPSLLAVSDDSNREYFSRTIPSKEFIGWLALVDETGQTVGSGGLVIDRHPPGPSNLSGQIGYIMNLSVDPRYRRQGIGRRILKTILEWLKHADIKLVSLHASEMGRSLYEELGFVETDELRLPVEMVKKLEY